jgi:hypothetical protein
VGRHGGIDAAETRAALIEQTLVYLGLSAALSTGVVPAGTAYPEAPPHWEIYQQVKAYGRLWWEGGLSDQPYWLMLELDGMAVGQERFDLAQRAAQAAAEAVRTI